MLEAIAAFLSGIGVYQLEGIFHEAAGMGEVVDVLCKFSLVHRYDGLVKMISHFQFYFLESMIVSAQTEEMINICWEPIVCLRRPAFPSRFIRFTALYTPPDLKQVAHPLTTLPAGKLIIRVNQCVRPCSAHFRVIV